MMIRVSDLVLLCDAFREAAGGLPESTLSHRMFGDSKRLTILRGGVADITVGRFNRSMRWLRDNWPEGAAMPALLSTLPALGEGDQLAQEALVVGHGAGACAGGVVLHGAVPFAVAGQAAPDGGVVEGIRVSDAARGARHG